MRMTSSLVPLPLQSKPSQTCFHPNRDNKNKPIWLPWISKSVKTSLDNCQRSQWAINPMFPRVLLLFRTTSRTRPRTNNTPPNNNLKWTRIYRNSHPSQWPLLTRPIALYLMTMRTHPNLSSSKSKCNRNLQSRWDKLPRISSLNHNKIVGKCLTVLSLSQRREWVQIMRMWFPITCLTDAR